MAEQKAKVVHGPGPGPRGRGPKPKIEHPWKLLGRLMKFVMKDYCFHYIAVAICIVVSVLANVQGTMFMKDLIDVYIKPMLETGADLYDGLLQAMGKIAIFYAIGIVAAFIQQRLMIYVTQGTLFNMRKAMFEHMESLPIKYFDTHAHGDIMSLYTNDIETLRQMISQSIPQFFNSLITIVSVLVCMITLSVPLTVLTLAMVALMLFCSKKLAGNSGKFFMAQQKAVGELNGFVEEMMEGQKVVKVFCHEEESTKTFDELNEKLFDSSFNANKFANILMPVNAQLGNVSYVLCAVLGGIIAIFGASWALPAWMKSLVVITPGTLVAFLNYNRSFNMPINQVSMQLNAIVMALAGCERIFALLDEKPETDEGYVTLVYATKDEAGNIMESDVRTGLWAWKHYHKDTDTTTYTELKGDVVFDGVDFGYTDEKIVLHDIKMFAEPGQKLAFVGSTGAGKTTITNLINRFYDIQDGKIRYDGININKIKKADLRKSLGIVLQDTHLFTGTVAENIRYGKLDATDEEVFAAARLANADSFIKHLPNGYDTVLTGDGANLSQGQRQLLAIARAAIADPPALILDEATSSIDTRTEKIVQGGMDKLMSGRTTFVIAHRLSTIKNSDCIMVMEQGSIVERGNHEELLNIGGRYYQLYTGNAAKTKA